MSRHTYKTTHDSRPVEVAAGWDRPLQGFYLTVLYTDDTEDYEYAFNNLETENAHPDQFDGFRDILADLNITLPAGMIEDIEADRRYNVGNKIVEWHDKPDPQGAFDTLWNALNTYRRDYIPEGDPDNDEQWLAIVSAMAAVTPSRFVIVTLIGPDWEQLERENAGEHNPEGTPVRYDTRTEAEAELEDHFESMSTAAMDYDRADYRIIEINQQ